MWNFIKKIWYGFVDFLQWCFVPEPEIVDTNENMVTENNVQYPSVPDEEFLDSMTKIELDNYAKTVWNIKLDRRKKKEAMISQFFKIVDENNV